ncbi:MAG TPA: hypothetical protein VFF24_08655 [Acidimicrobiia bacterium]|nr:hypothetical protein [Acidimicrobiia bacterium]
MRRHAQLGQPVGHGFQGIGGLRRSLAVLQQAEQQLAPQILGVGVHRRLQQLCPRVTRRTRRAVPPWRR